MFLIRVIGYVIPPSLFVGYFCSTYGKSLPDFKKSPGQRSQSISRPRQRIEHDWTKSCQIIPVWNLSTIWGPLSGAACGGQSWALTSSFERRSTGEFSTLSDHFISALIKEVVLLSFHGDACRLFCLDLIPAPKPGLVSPADFK